jgi:tetratricopeptide (TPR) repeat protein
VAKAREALAIRQKVLGPEHPDTATSLNNLGLLLQAQGDYAAARPYFEQALAIRKKALGEDHPEVATSLNNLAGLYQKMGQYEKAEPLYRRSLKIREDRLGKDHPAVANSLNNLAGLYLDLGQYAQAEPLYQRSLNIEEAGFGKDHPLTAQSYNNLAANLSIQGKYRDAFVYFRNAEDILEHISHSSNPAVVASCWNNIGEFYLQMGNIESKNPVYFEKARQYFEKALQHWDIAIRNAWGQNHEEIRLNRALTLAHLGNHVGATEEADQLARRNPLPGSTLYELAHVYAVASKAIGRDSELSQMERDELTEKYAARAIKLLEQARDAGYFKVQGRVDHLKKDIAWDTLRQQDGFRELLGGPAQPPVPTAPWR